MTGKRYFITLQRGMTLLELSVVMLILIILAGLAMPYVRGTGDMAACQVTDATMQAVKQAIMGGAAGTGYYSNMLGELPRDKNVATGYKYSLHYLFFRDDGVDNDGDGNLPSSDGKKNVDPDDEWQAYNAKTGVGWSGPYLQSGGLLSTESVAALDSSFGAYDATANPDGKAHIDHRVTSITQVFDAWGRPIILQIPYDTSTTPPTPKPEYARLVSAGPTVSLAVIDTKIQYDSKVNPLPDALDRNNDRVLYLKMPDPLPGGNQPCNE